MGAGVAIARVERVLRSLQWSRGLRAGVAVAGAMIACNRLGLPMGWAALGGFEAVLVDNGGPYRSRLETIATLLAGGSLVCVIGAMVGGTLWVAVAVTAAVCFAATFARVASERIASTSVIILVLYFAGFGGTDHSFAHACAAALEFALGGLWAAALSLVLWPVDPFRPARREVAECYSVLAEFSGKMLVEEWSGDATGDGVRSHVSESRHGAPDFVPRSLEERRISLEHTGHFQRAMRLQMEKARHAVGRVPARMTARTVRARNLTVLLETADMLFAITMRWRELAQVANDPASFAAVREAALWLSGAEWAISRGLRQRPGDGAASYTPEGSHSMEHVQPRLKRPRWPFAKGTARAHLAADERDALENVQIAFEAVRSVWSGVELRVGGAATRWEMIAHDPGHIDVPEKAADGGHYRWVDALRANWTFDSVMMRHALRMAVVGGVDILLMRLTHVRHGSWLAMTSIIVLQPYGSGTLRRGMQRVGGTIAGGVLAAVLATAIHGQAGLIAVLAVVSALTLATYAVNYAWYCFFSDADVRTDVDAILSGLELRGSPHGKYSARGAGSGAGDEAVVAGARAFGAGQAAGARGERGRRLSAGDAELLAGEWARAHGGGAADLGSCEKTLRTGDQ